MLIVTRKAGQVVRIEPEPGLDPSTPISALFGAGPIEVVVARIRGPQVKLGILADPRLMILREELAEPVT